MLYNPRHELELWQKLLLDAADLIEIHGHCKYALINEQGNFCFMGALNKVVNDNPFASIILNRDAVKAIREFEHFLDPDLKLTFWGSGIVNYNNHPTTKSEDLILKMRECATRPQRESCEAHPGHAQTAQGE